MELCRKLNDKLGEAVAYRGIGECYSELGEYNEAVAAHKKFLRIAESLNNAAEIQRAWATLGRTHLDRAEESDEKYLFILQRAENAFQQALQACER